MSMISVLDAKCVATLQQICWKIEKNLGLSNYFLLKLLTGAYATCVLVVIIIDEIYRASSLSGNTGNSGNNIFLFFLFLWFFYVSFFYCDNAEQFARERQKAKLENPKKVSAIWVSIRCSMLVSLLLLILFFVFLSQQFPDRLSDMFISIYMITSCATSLLFWVGLQLDACDPSNDS